MGVNGINPLTHWAFTPKIGWPCHKANWGQSRISGVVSRLGKNRKSARWSVSRVLSTVRTRWDDHSSGTQVALRLARPTRTTMWKPIFRQNRSSPDGRPYLVLLQVGFTLPRPLPAARCALTAPFHPYHGRRAEARLPPAVCFLWHFPWGRPRRALPGTLSPWSPDFPPPRRERRNSGHPTIWPAHHEREG